jgi:hypothetical protein
MSDAGDAGSGAPPTREPATDRFDPRPGRAALPAVLLPAVVAALALLASGVAGLLGAVGLGLLAVGTRAGRRNAVGAGGVTLLAGALVAGATGADPAVLLVAGGAGLAAWDTADHAVGLAEQVGRRAATGRSVGVHAAGSGLLAALGVAVAYGAFRSAGGGTPLALVLLLGGGIALLRVLRR